MLDLSVRISAKPCSDAVTPCVCWTIFPRGKRENLPVGIELLEGDAADESLMRRAVEDVAGCFHLAAIASVERGVIDWLGTHRANLTATITLFDAVRRLTRKVPVVYASSAAVYGDVATMPITEDSDCRPLSAYGADKFACELHARVASHVHAVPTVGLRFFNVYGPRQDPASPYSGVISIFCDKLRRGEPIRIFGDGSQTRDFVFVADVVGALLSAMHLRPADAPVFNVCTGTPAPILDLAHTIAELAGTRPTIQFAPSRAGEIRHSTGSPARTRAALSLAEPMPLREGLATVLDWLGRPS